MLVFEFSGKSLLAKLDFSMDDSGLADFKDFIQQCEKQTSRLVVDVRDEDFVREQVPHVKGRDRTRLLERMEKRAFRDAKYRFTYMLGRQKEGRRDDLVLFSSLLETENFNRCMEAFRETGTPLLGIWSVAFLSSELLKRLKIKDDDVLLFSRQMRSAVRETLFKRGQLYVSRQAKLDRLVRTERSAETSATIVATNVEVMHRFLINQRVVNAGDMLHVYSIVYDEYIEKLEQHCESTNNLSFHFLGLKEVFDRFGFAYQKGLQSDVLFCFIASRMTADTQQYLPAQAKRPYYMYVADQAIRAATLAGSIVSIITATFLLLNSSEFSREKNIEQVKFQKIQTEYNKAFSAIEHQIADAQKIKESVELIENMTLEADLAPHNLFPQIGGVFASEEFSMFNVTSLIWEKHTPNEMNAIATGYSDLRSATVPESEQFEEYIEESYHFQPSLRLRGLMNRRGLSYSQTVMFTDALINSFRAIPLVTDVHILVNPVDVRLGSKFTDISGQAKNDKERKDFAEYDLRLILKSASPVFDEDGESYATN